MMMIAFMLQKWFSFVHWWSARVRVFDFKFTSFAFFFGRKNMLGGKSSWSKISSRLPAICTGCILCTYIWIHVCRDLIHVDKHFISVIRFIHKAFLFRMSLPCSVWSNISLSPSFNSRSSCLFTYKDWKWLINSYKPYHPDTQCYIQRLELANEFI